MKDQNKRVFLAIIGSFLEWAEFTYYAYIASEIAKLFFPIEHDANTPYRAGSWTGLASALGMMFGSLMSVLIYLPHMPTWAWRIPFLFGANYLQQATNNPIAPIFYIFITSSLALLVIRRNTRYEVNNVSLELRWY